MNERNNSLAPLRSCSFVVRDNCTRTFSTFYTNWSFFAIFVAFIITIGLLPYMHTLNTNKWAGYVVFGFIISAAVNSIAVAITSQIIIMSKWSSIEFTDDQLDEYWVQQLNNKNMLYHMAPLIISVLLLLVVVNVPANLNKTYLFIMCCMMPMIFFVCWSCLNVLDNNEKHTLFRKVSVVYDNPDTIVTASFPIVIVVITAMYIFILN